MEVANYLADGIEKQTMETVVEKTAIADGGDGFLSVFPAKDMEYHKLIVENAVGKLVKVEFGIYKRHIAIIEMAKASGIAMLGTQNPLHPFYASSFGTGQVIRHVLSLGVSHIYLGVGGTATNDGGAGIAQALGVQLLDKNKNEISRGAMALHQLMTISTQRIAPQLKNTPITIFADVRNQLCGPYGATYTFGVQKGAKTEELPYLDTCLQTWAKKLEEYSGKSLMHTPGIGAGGGAGLPLLALGNTIIVEGAGEIINILELEQKIAQADFIITGEGKLDNQSSQGKLPFKIANLAQQYNKKCIAVVGSKSSDLLPEIARKFSAIYTLVSDSITQDKALNNTLMLLKKIGTEIDFSAFRYVC